LRHWRKPGTAKLPWSGTTSITLSHHCEQSSAAGTRRWREEDYGGDVDHATLDAFGLDAEQRAFYECLLTSPPMSQADLADVAAQHGWKLVVGSTLHQLQSLGLVARVPSDPPTWAVVPPDTALDTLLLAREQVLAAARRRATELATRFHSGRSGRAATELVEVIYGQPAVLSAIEQMQRSARVEVCAADAPPYATALPAESHPVNDIEIELLASGVPYRVIYDPRGLDRPGRLADLQAGIAAGEQARVGEVPVKLLITDQSRALLPLHSRPTDFVSALRIEESTLVDALHELFEMYWERAISLQVGNGQTRPADPAGPTPAGRSVLPLLVAGLSDVAIARQLKWNERTVRRHVRGLLAELGAETRFQAGYQAVARGWLGEDTGGTGAAG
jgi:DNA-binding NarL/FixJ family response regulator